MFQSFIFDTASNDNYGVMGVSFSSAEETKSAGLQTEIQQERAAKGNRYYIVEQAYKEPLTFQLQIINQDGSPFTSIKERQIKNWLCHQGEYRWFRVNEDEVRDYWYYVNISNPQLIDFGGIIGMEFTVTCDAPFAYSPLITKTLNFTANSSNTIMIQSDTEEYVCPTISLNIGTTGNFTLTNSTEVEHRTIDIDGLLGNEIIDINPDIPTIITNRVAHQNTIYTDWNKNYLRLINGYNILTSNLPCTLTITYREIREVGIR